MQQLLQLPVILGVALLGGWLAGRLNIPGAVILGSMLAVLGLKILGPEPLALPKEWSFLLQIAVGATVAMRFSPALLLQMRDYAIPILGSALLLILVGTLSAVVISKYWGVDIGTAFVSTSPGAMTAMVGMAGGLNVDIFLVLTFHITRVILVILLAPAILKLCRALL